MQEGSEEGGERRDSRASIESKEEDASAEMVPKSVRKSADELSEVRGSERERGVRPGTNDGVGL